LTQSSLFIILYHCSTGNEKVLATLYIAFCCFMLYFHRNSFMF